MEKTPFSVLELPPDADITAARSRYRKLAREHHPDSAPDRDQQSATRVMADLNWAIEEIERNPVRWHVAAGEAETQRSHAHARPVSVTPTLVLLNEEGRYTSYVTAAAPGVDGSAVRLRYASNLIEVERLPAFSGVANFRIRLAEGIKEIAAPVRKRLEIRAPHCRTVEINVAIEPFAAADAPMPIEAEQPTGRCWLDQALVGGTLALGALTALIYLT